MHVLRRAVAGSTLLLHFGFRLMLIAFCVLLICYVACFIAAYSGGKPIPAAYLFQLAPVSKVFHRFEPHFPFLVIIASLSATALTWLGGWDAAVRRDLHRQDIKSIRIWRWLGLPAVAGMFLVFIAASAWSGNVAIRDQPYMNIAGLVPNSDARGYFYGALDFLLLGSIDSWNLRRPLATVFRAITVLFGNYDYVGTIIAQIGAISVAVYLATSSIIRWRGLNSGVVFLAIAFIMTRGFLATTYTEPLALFWAFLSLPLIIHGLQRDSFASLVTGLSLIVLALFIRMGPMLVIPAIALWIFLYVGSNFRYRIINTVVFLLVAAIVTGSNFAIQKLVGQAGAQIGANYTSTLCGMSIGGIWADCYTKYAAEVATVSTEREVSELFYRITLKNVMEDPTLFLHSMSAALLRFLSVVPRLPVTWYMWPQSAYFPVWTLYLFAGFGWTYTLWRAARWSDIAFCLLFAAGILISVPLIYFEDAGRVMAAIFPVLALGLVGGIFAPGTLRLGSPVKMPIATSAVAIVGVISVALFMSLSLAWRHPEYRNIAKVDVDLVTGERIISGRFLQTGLIVVADTEELLLDAPSMKLTKFREFLRAGNVDPDNSGFPLPDAPFAFIGPYEKQRAFSSYFAPPQVFRDRSVRWWKVRVVPANSHQQWVQAIDAVPLP
jgi:hypothetical protein